MGAYLARRMVLLVFTLVGLSVLTFFVARVAPADPARLAAGPDATPAMVAALRQEFGLDRPLLMQYGTYLRDLFTGDMGRSIRSRRPVTHELRDYFPATLELVLFSLGLSMVLGIPLGVLSAVYKDRWVDHASRLLAVSGVGMPAFWLALLLQLLLVSHLGWLPLGGRLDPEMLRPPRLTGFLLIDSVVTGRFDALVDALRHLVLPAVALSFPALASVIRVERADVLDVLDADYVRTARAKGVHQRGVIWRHVLRNALIPSATMMGLRFGWMLGGTVLVETVFDWPGLGLYITQAITFSDFEPIVGATLAIGLSFALANLLVDLAYGWLDPRIRYE